MKLSARNQIEGTVEQIKKGAVNAIVILNADPFRISSTISLDAVEALGLKEGQQAVAVIKASEVMIAIGELKISARNRFPGVIAEIEEGLVNCIVKVKTDSGEMISATISKDAVEDMGLTKGLEVSAIVKSTSVIIASNE